MDFLKQEVAAHGWTTATHAEVGDGFFRVCVGKRKKMQAEEKDLPMMPINAELRYIKRKREKEMGDNKSRIEGRRKNNN